jgi:hypothetical protein
VSTHEVLLHSCLMLAFEAASILGPGTVQVTRVLPLQVWLAEECRLLEQKNYELQRDLKAAHAATEHARTLAESSRQVPRSTRHGAP